MATPGTYISAIGHTGLIIWLIAGWGFSQEPLPFEVSQVSVVTGEQFAAMVAATTPNPATADPTTPVSPPTEAPPTPPAAVAETAPLPAPDAAAAPTAELPPPLPPEPPAPVQDVTDTVPDQPLPPSDASPAIDEPVVNDTPQERPSDRVAPDPVAPPPPDTQVADVPQEAVSPDAQTPDTVQDPPQPELSAEAATSRIVTEAATPSGAVEKSLRPLVRPERATPPTETPTAAATETPPAQAAEAAPATDEAAVAAALEAAVAATESPAVAEGPPMTGSETEGFRVAVNSCWNVDPGSVAARVTVEVGFSLNREGKVEGDVRLMSSDGDQSAVDTAFQAARRAILRCQKNGYELPADKYDQWRDVIIVFDPSGMKLR